MLKKEPERWYDWIGWKLRQEDKKEKPIEDQVVGISAGAGGRNISEEFNICRKLNLCQLLQKK